MCVRLCVRVCVCVCKGVRDGGTQGLVGCARGCWWERAGVQTVSGCLRAGAVGVRAVQLAHPEGRTATCTCAWGRRAAARGRAVAPRACEDGRTWGCAGASVHGGARRRAGTGMHQAAGVHGTRASVGVRPWAQQTRVGALSEPGGTEKPFLVFSPAQRSPGGGWRVPVARCSQTSAALGGPMRVHKRQAETGGTSKRRSAAPKCYSKSHALGSLC